MSEEKESPVDMKDVTIDPANLYREDVYTDRRVGSLRMMVPVKTDGEEDTSRDRLFTGHTQIMSAMGAVPIQAEIHAASLDEAIEKFPAAVNQAVEDLIAEAQRRQREEASRIVVPGAGPGALPGADGPFKL